MSLTFEQLSQTISRTVIVTKPNIALKNDVFVLRIVEASEYQWISLYLPPLLYFPPSVFPPY